MKLRNKIDNFILHWRLNNHKRKYLLKSFNLKLLVSAIFSLMIRFKRPKVWVIVSDASEEDCTRYCFSATIDPKNKRPQIMCDCSLGSEYSMKELKTAMNFAFPLHHPHWAEYGIPINFNTSY